MTDSAFFRRSVEIVGEWMNQVRSSVIRALYRMGVVGAVGAR